MRLKDHHFMVSLCVLAFITGTSIAAKQNDKHMFKIVPSNIDLDPPQIFVTFPSGIHDEFVLKHHIVGPSMKKRCNYLGHIQNSLSSSVAVTGCMKKPGDKIDITMISPHSGLKMYSVDYFGNAEAIEIPKDAVQVIETREDKKDDEIVYNKEEEELAATEKIGYIPPVVRGVVKFGYDKGLIEVLDKYNTTLEDWFNGVLTHTQAHFREGRLGTIIELEVSYPHIYRDDVRWNSCENFNDVKAAFAKYATTLDDEEVAFRAWFVGIQKCGYYGVGAVGYLCSGSALSVNVGHPGSPALDSSILAHEMGHNLGLGHCKRVDEDGDWYWNSCHIATFQKHFTLNKLERGCLVDISGGCDPNPCKNGGKCTEMTYNGIEKTVMKNAVSFKCECKEGTSGARCEYVEGGCYGGDDCCTEKRKCGLDEGHCKSDKDCKEGLKCGSGNCYNWYSKLWWKGHDCCFKPDTCASRSLERFEPKGFYGTCVFPFTKNSTVYNSCAETKKYDGIGWCAWDSEYKEDRWGYCTPSCPNACHQGCQCREERVGDKLIGDDIDDEGYCRNWCRSRHYTCGHTQAHIDGIDCRGCNNNENDFVCSGEENCCHPFHKCGENEGQCRFDTDCQDGMRCVDKLCYQSECAKKEGPCKVSQGDCDALSDCEEGLVCGSDNCPKGINKLTNADFTDDDDCCYQPKGYVPLGCWEEAKAVPDRAIPEYLGYENKRKAIKGCYQKAWKKGFKVFAVRYGGECWSSKDAIETYNKYGFANDCWDGIGGDYSNAVYQITDFEFNQGAIGEDCWYECGKKQGPCAWCGSEGWCCTQKSGWTDTSNGCDGTFGGVSKHECALKPN